MIKCAIFGIGEELLEGSVLDTNSSFIARELSAKGISPRFIALLPDDGKVITEVIRNAMAEYPLVITTGGLGPTFDDLTADAVAAACGKSLVLYDEVKEHITQRLGMLRVQTNDTHLRQAMLPAEASMFPNPHGTAYGFGVEFNGSMVLCMPGVPSEMKPMMTEQLIPFIGKHFPFTPPYRATLQFGNLPESDLDGYIREIGIPADVQCIINASSGDVLLKVRSQDYKAADAFAQKVKQRFIKQYYASDGQSPAEVLIELLKEKKMTLSVAESCTGGLLGGALTSVSGASEVFLGGIISYDNKVKMNQLGVSAEILDKFGAVSEECASAMACGVQDLIGSDCAISVTGIAGPGGGTPEKPVGTVWLGFRINANTYSKVLRCSGGREDVRARSVKSAIISLIQLLNEI